MKKHLQRILCVLFCATSAKAADIYWDGTGSDWDTTNSWSTASAADNPDPAAVPGASDNAIFNITTVDSAQTVNLNGDQSANKLTFDNTGTTLLQVDGNNTDTNTLSLGGGGINVNSGAGNVTIGPGATYPNEHLNVALTAGQTWTVAGGTQLTLNDSVSGEWLGKTGTGTLTLNGVSNSLSSISVSCAGTGNGAVIVTNSASLTVAGNFFLGDGINTPGTVLQYGGEVNLNGNVRIAHWPNWAGTRSTYTISGGVLNVTNNNTLNLGWDGQGDLNVNGGTVNAKGIRYGWGSHGGRAGILTLSGGTLNIGSLGMSQGQNGTINLNSGTLGALAGWSTGMDMNLGGTVDVDTTGGDITWSGTLSGTGGVAKVGTGSLILNNVSCLSTNTDLYISSGGTVDLDFTGTNVIRSLTIDGALIPRTGVYNSENKPSHLEGTGNLLTLVGGPKGTVISIQ